MGEEVKEIRTIRELMEAVKAKHGLDALHHWEAGLQADAMYDYKKWELIELILDGTKVIKDTTFEEYVEEMYSRHDDLGEAAEELGDLAEGLLPEPKIVILETLGWKWECPEPGCGMTVYTYEVEANVSCPYCDTKYRTDKGV